MRLSFTRNKNQRSVKPEDEAIRSDYLLVIHCLLDLLLFNRLAL